MKLSIGDMRALITIEHIVAEKDPITNQAERWGVYAKAWFEVVITAGGEAVAGQQNTGSNIWRCRTHLTPLLAGVTSRMRAVTAGGKRLGIKSAINEDVANRVFAMLCEETT